MDVAAFLAGAALTAALDQDTRDALAERLEPVAVDSGETLVRQAEIGDALYFVVSGRLAVIAEAEEGPRLVGRISAGAVVGELALLGDTPRLATVVAVRDSRLLRLSRAAFEEVAQRYPDLLRAVGRTVVQRLGERGRAPVPAGKTIALVGVGAGGNAAVHALLQPLQEALLAHGAVAVLRPGADDGGADLGHELAVREDAAVYVLLACDDAGGHTAWCMRSADLVFLVADASGRPAPSQVEAVLAELARTPLTAPDVHLVLHHQAAGAHRGASAWTDRMAVRNVFHVVGGDTTRLARFAAGRAVGLALGGGGARGFAHLGVLRALDEAGVVIDVVAGTSIGALIAALYAMGWDPGEREERVREALTRSGSLFGVTLPVLSLSSASKLHALLTDERYLSDRWIEDLPVPYCCVSADLGRAETVEHDRGPLAQAVRASISLPGVLPPVAAGDRWLIDGGVLDNLPVTAVRSRNGGGPVIAVDIRPQVDLSMTRDLGPAVSGWSLVGRRGGGGRRVPSLLDVLVRSNILGSIRSQQDVLGADPVDLLLRPPVQSVRILDFRAGVALMESAYRYTVETLAAEDPVLLG